MARCRATSLGLAAVLAFWAPAASGQAAGEPPPAGRPAPIDKAAEAPAAKKAAPKGPARKPSAAELKRQRAEEERRQAEEARQAEIQALQERIRALEAQIEKLEALSAQSQGRLERLEDEVPRIGQSVAARDERLKQLEETTRKLPEAADVVKAGDFPGSFRIPGTDAALKIGGQVRVTLVDSFDAIGTDDRFVTSSIPIQGTAAAGKGSRLVLTAAPSRFNLDFRTPTGIGAMRAFIEADFAGSRSTLRLRHAFGQWDRFIFGQTWSTFADPEAEPDGIDFEGLNAISLFRQVQIRYTVPLAETLTLAAALENPLPEVTGAAGVTQVPDVILRLRWDPQKELGWVIRTLGHVQLAVVLRQIRAEPSSPPPAHVHVVGFGLGASGRLNTGWIFESDDLTFSTYWGKGIARYITDLDSYFGETGDGQDAFYDPPTGELRALPALASYLGYELGWSRALRSTFTVGWVRIWNLDVQPPDSLKQTLRASANFAWSPVTRLDFVAELLVGRRWDKDGQWGRAIQLQIGTRFRF
jgi:hypothetical protein